MQRALVVAPKKAPAGMFAVVVIRNRKSGEGVRYSIAAEWGAKTVEWNRTLDPAGRYDAVMGAEGIVECGGCTATLICQRQC